MKQTINTGLAPNDRKGDKLRDAYTKTNQNFAELYNSKFSFVTLDASSNSVLECVSSDTGIFYIIGATANLTLNISNSNISNNEVRSFTFIIQQTNNTASIEAVTLDGGANLTINYENNALHDYTGGNIDIQTLNILNVSNTYVTYSYLNTYGSDV